MSNLATARLQYSILDSHVIELNMDYGKLCHDVLDLDPKVRFVGVCDNTGVIKNGGLREGIKSFLTDEEIKKANLITLERWRLHNTMADRIGKARYAMEEYEKVKQITMPLEDEHLLLISTEVDAEHGKIIESAIQLIISNYVKDYL
ncbi:MAG TPA: hypothetical protein VJS91_08700 [Nitrososphaeraceae archaeon]|nr:hypothetical protein [Nitrososphaeraceae archaeon]